MNEFITSRLHCRLRLNKYFVDVRLEKRLRGCNPDPSRRVHERPPIYPLMYQVGMQSTRREEEGKAETSETFPSVNVFLVFALSYQY